MTLVDYYQLLGVARTASQHEIEQAIKKGIRTWSKQTSRPELEKRQEAERKMQQLREARETLLDPGRRQQYDHQLAAAPPPQAAPQARGGDWLELARNALEMGDFVTADRAAQEAQHGNGESPELRSIRARANAGLGRYEDAVFEAQRAVQLAPNDPENLATLAEIFEDLGHWDNALRCYEGLARLEPGSEYPQIGIASVLMARGDINGALSLLERVHGGANDKRLSGDYLAMALVEAAEQVPRVQDEDGYAITSSEEIARMRGMLLRARQVTANPNVLADVAGVQAYVDRSATRRFVAGRMVAGVVGKLGVGALVVAVLLLCCAGYGMTTGDGPGAAALVLVLIGGIVTGLVFWARVPQWKLNRWGSR